ncbi:MAG: apolipoprotein N-acyltransferase, partial [Alphaproteobacteria bacterium]
YGLSFLTVFCFALISTKIKPLLLLSATILCGLWFYGQNRLQNYPETLMHPINIRLVQPCIEQQGIWTPETRYDNLARHIELSQLAGERPLHAVIWPESSVPFFIGQQPLFQSLLQESVPPHGLLIVGGPRLDTQSNVLHASLFAINTQGSIVGTYDKAHLVPFGEYVPLKALLPFNKLSHGSRDYTPGTGIQTLNVAPLPPFSPLICFEAIFPSAVTLAGQPPQWLLNITNDAWYGLSSGPSQHLQNVRVRAIEEGLPLVRSANNGISAVIDPMGRILYQLSTDVVGYIDFQLPRALASTTIYAKYRDMFFWLFVCLIAAWLLRTCIKDPIRSITKIGVN